MHLAKENGIHRLKNPVRKDIIEPTWELLVMKLTASESCVNCNEVGFKANIGGTAEKITSFPSLL